MISLICIKKDAVSAVWGVNSGRGKVEAGHPARTASK